MATSSVPQRDDSPPNDSDDAEIPVLLERVCASLPSEFTRRLVRDVVRMKLEFGLEGEVRDYLKRRSGEYPAIPALVPNKTA
jgi:hypothetical protein